MKKKDKQYYISIGSAQECWSRITENHFKRKVKYLKEEVKWLEYVIGENEKLKKINKAKNTISSWTWDNKDV